MKISTKVTVSPKEIKATGINITSNTSLSLNIGDVSDITYELTPSDTTDKISFSTSNSSVASVDKNGKITALSAGSATVTVKAGTNIFGSLMKKIERAMPAIMSTIPIFLRSI